MNEKRGKFIVLDGTDGTGKKTQMDLLAERLRASGCVVAIEDFPQYGKKSAGPVEEYLTGVYGTAQELGPYIPSTFYAVDRFAASPRIRTNLDNGIIVISNRYVTANMGHQGGKISSAPERNEYYKWLFHLEYEFYKIPAPDLNLILHIPASVAQKLVDEKGSREYVGGKKRDIHEADLSHLEAAERTYLEISQKFGYPLVECYEDGRILTREEISDKVWIEVQKVLRK